uniref:hypothetical protein n=1 Tax=Streptomyces chartreusis TaxID=1969 RepID=UPI003F499081
MADGRGRLLSWSDKQEGDLGLDGRILHLTEDLNPSAPAPTTSPGACVQLARLDQPTVRLSRAEPNPDNHHTLSIPSSADPNISLVGAGLIAYVEHGSKRNALRSRHGARWKKEHGYRGTATLFAALAPRVWDEAMGRRIRGQGYKARMVGVTPAGRILAVACAEDQRWHRADGQPSRPVDNSRPCTPSVEVPKPHTTVAVVEEITDSTRKRTCRKKGDRRHRGKGSTNWTAARTAAAMQEARYVRLHTWWTQGSCIRQLAYALRPCFEAGWTWEEVARELARWTVPLRPRHVASYVASELRRRVNTGQLHLPDGLIAPYRQPKTSTWDDGTTPHGPNYATMQALKTRTYRPAAARAAAQRWRSPSSPGSWLGFSSSPWRCAAGPRRRWGGHPRPAPAPGVASERCP